MTTLLIAEHDNAHLKDATHKALTAAAALGSAVHVLVAGANARAAAEAASKLEGVEKVLLADSPAYEHQLAEPLAALLDVMQVSDITKVVAPDTFERPIYAGNAIQTVQATDAKRVLTVRTAAFAAAAEGGSAAIEAGAGGGGAATPPLQGGGGRPAGAPPASPRP